MEVVYFFVIDCKPIVMQVYVLGILKINIVVGDVSEKLAKVWYWEVLSLQS